MPTEAQRAAGQPEAYKAKKKSGKKKGTRSKNSRHSQISQLDEGDPQDVPSSNQGGPLSDSS